LVVLRRHPRRQDHPRRRRRGRAPHPRLEEPALRAVASTSTDPRSHATAATPSSGPTGTPSRKLTHSPNLAGTLAPGVITPTRFSGSHADTRTISPLFASLRIALS